jgi:hypothetical protein
LTDIIRKYYLTPALMAYFFMRNEPMSEILSVSVSSSILGDELTSYSILA